MPHYTKTCKLPEDLISLLKGRGLSFSDENQAIDYLSHIGYFRLSAYLRPLYQDPKNAHIFKTDATFEKAMFMYRFDRKLRILLFNEIEKIEVAIRSAISNFMSNEVNDVFWMTDPRYFHNRSYFSQTQAIIDKELHRTREDFIIHFRATYSDPYPPAWMIAEILPLGVICKLYSNLKLPRWKKRIANQFGLTAPVLDSWMQVLGQVRNLCGHHSRVWNRELMITPADPSNIVYGWIDRTQTDYRRLYCRVCMIKYFLCSVSPHNTFEEKLALLFVKFPTVDINAMGFPDTWANDSIWKDNG